MKKSSLLLVAIAVLLIIVLLFLLSRCHHGTAEAAEGCGPGTANGECKADIEVGSTGVSIWSDSTVSLAIAVENRGGRGAGDVNVTALTLGVGHRTDPATLPVALGEIASRRRAVIQALFTGLTVPGSYLLTVSGSYIDHGKTLPFTSTTTLNLQTSASSPTPSVNGVLPKQHTPGVPTKPTPIRPEVEESNPLGPPVPRGPDIHPFTVAPTTTPVNKAPPPGGTAGGITFVQDTGFKSSITNAPPDPDTTIAASANIVLDTDNTALQYSTDGGKTFSSVDPTTIFPQSDGGMCCDQVVLYDSSHDLIFWLQQYNAASGAGGTNRLRIAWTSPASLKANVNAWTYLDLTQPGFNSGGALDYPDLALTSNFLYVSVDGANSTGKVSGLIVTRLSLSDIVGASGSVGFSYIGPNETTDMNRAIGSHLTQSSSDAMYWAGTVDTSHMEVFHWPDSASSVSNHQTAINQWCNQSIDYANLPPDKQQWPDTGHLGGAGNIVAATRTPGFGGANGKVWFGWGAGKDSSTDCKTQSGRPLPFVKIVQIDDTTLDSVGEYHIWNSAYAFSYPALATDPAGAIGVSVAFAGSANYPSSTVGYIGDFVVYYVEASTVSLQFYIDTAHGTFTFTNPGDGSITSDSSGNPIIFTRYGDYFSVRSSGGSNSTFSNQGYAVSLVDSTKSTSCLTTPGCVYHPHYEQWGRPATPPPR